MIPLWPYYRVVLEHYATLGEVDDLSIDDIDEMCIMADAYAEAGRGER